MNFIATVNTPSHGHISVTFSDNDKSVLGAWRDNVTIELSGKEKQQITNDIICNRRHKRVFEKAYVSTSGFGVFIFPYAAVASAGQNSSSSPRRSRYGLKQNPDSTLPNRKQWGRGCASPTTPSSAKTSSMKQESTRGVSRAGTT